MAKLPVPPSPLRRLSEWFHEHPLAADIATAFSFLILVISGAGILHEFATERHSHSSSPRVWTVIVLMLLLLVAIVVLLSRLSRISRERMRELEARTRQLELERDQREQLAIATERARIAREMHDVVAHSLTVLVTMADGAAVMIDKDPARAKAALEQMSETGRQALADTRRLVGVLRSPNAKPLSTTKQDTPEEANADSPSQPILTPSVDEIAPLSPSPDATDLNELIKQFRQAGLPIRFDYQGDDLPDDKQLQLTVFRIIQEGLTNVLRHAPESPDVSVSIVRKVGSAVISVTNATSEKPGKYQGSKKGLIGMRERAAVFGGQVDAGPTETGWKLQASLHWKEENGEVSQWIMPK